MEGNLEHYRLVYMLDGFLAFIKQKAIWNIVGRFMNNEISKEELQTELRDVFPLQSASQEEMADVLKICHTLGYDLKTFDERVNDTYMNKPKLYEALKGYTLTPIEKPTQDCSR